MDPLDLRGLKCPLPALYAKRALKRAEAGVVLEVVTDDPMAPIDIPHMCAQEGFDVLGAEKEASVARFRLCRPAPA